MPEPAPGNKNKKTEESKEILTPETPEAVPSAPAPELPRESEADRAAAIEQARTDINAFTGSETNVEGSRAIEVPRAATFLEFAKLLNPEQATEMKRALTETYWGGLGDDAARLIDGETLPNLNPAYPGIDPATIHILDFFSQSGIDQADLEQTLGITFV